MKNQLCYAAMAGTFWILSCGVFAQPKECESGSQDARLKCYKRAFEKADLELNSTYKSLLRLVDAQGGEKARSNSVQWIRAKEERCKFIKEQSSVELDYWKCVYEITVQRTDFLDKIGKAWKSPGLAGLYEDGLNGSLLIKEIDAKTVNFSIDVVRGPSAHLGHIEGNVPKADGLIKFRHIQDGLKCELDLLVGLPVITVTEKDCGGFHGARAYFDGTYFKVAPASSK